MPRLLFLFVATVSSTAIAALGAVAGEAPDHALSGNEIELIGFVAAGVFAVVATIAWIDRRIDRKLAEHNRLDEIRDRARSRLDKMRHRESLLQLHHLHQLVAQRVGIPAPPPPVFEEEEPSEPQGGTEP